MVGGRVGGCSRASIPSPSSGGGRAGAWGRERGGAAIKTTTGGGGMGGRRAWLSAPYQSAHSCGPTCYSLKLLLLHLNGQEGQGQGGWRAGTGLGRGGELLSSPLFPSPHTPCPKHGTDTMAQNLLGSFNAQDSLLIPALQISRRR